MNDTTKAYGSLAKVADAFGLKPKAGSAPAVPTNLAPPESAPRLPDPTLPKATPSKALEPAKEPAPTTTNPVHQPVGKPTGAQVPVTTPVPSLIPPKEGTLQVLDPLHLQEPETGHKVFASPPEYIRVRMGAAEYRVTAGQDFLNTGTSARYKADPTAIKGSKAQLRRPMLDKSGGEAPEDVRVIGDGHHRFIWGAFARLPVAADSKSLPMIVNPGSNLTYKEAPGVEPTIKPVVKSPSKAVKTPPKTEKAEGTEKTAATEKVWPSMGRIENPEWSRIEPLLRGYGITTEDNERKIKATLDENLKDTENSWRERAVGPAQRKEGCGVLDLAAQGLERGGTT